MSLGFPPVSRLSGKAAVPILWSCLLLPIWGCSVPHSRASRTPQTRFLFSEIAQKAGIRFVHRNGQGAGANIIETTGTGCGVFDYDNDG
ncbi:MAG: hypothetical protein ACP5VE_02935 [Chthonomonadales bacterium]